MYLEIYKIGPWSDAELEGLAIRDGQWVQNLATPKLDGKMDR